MFEREIKFIYDFNLNKVNKLGPYFTFEQLASTELHPAILHYISAEIDYLIFEDRHKLLKNSVFDYSGDKITQLFSQISEEVKRNKRFSLEYISKLILHASSFNVNFLVRPKWTLIKFIFDEGDHKTTAEIKQILNYLSYHKYLKKILVSYINKKKIISLNSSEFTDLLDKVDQLGVEAYLPSIISSSLKSMAEFLNIGEVQKTKIPLSAVVMFLEEKKLDNHYKKVVTFFGEDKSAKFSINEYQKVLESVLLEKEEIVEEEPEVALEPVSDEPQIDLYEQKTEEVENIKSESEIQDEKEEIIESLKHADEDVQPEMNEIEKLPADQEIVEEYTEEEISEVEGDSESQESENVIQNKEPEEEILDVSTLDLEPEPDVDYLADDEEKSDETYKDEKQVKYRFKFGEDDELERIEDNNKEPGEEKTEKPENTTEPDMFNDFEESVVVDESSEPEPDEEIHEEEQNNENVFDEIDSRIDSRYDEETGASGIFEKEIKDRNEPSENSDKIRHEFDEDDELNDIYRIADENIKKAEEVNLDENDNESMLQSILNSSDEDQIEHEIKQNPRDDVTESDEDEKSQKIDLAELLEHKEMTKIIEVVFDYDIEDFSNTLDEIIECRLLEDAFTVINNSLKEHGVSRKSKEAELFRQIISDYFERD